MAITFVAVGTQVAGNTGTPITPPLPSGWQADDLAVLVIVGRPVDDSTTEPGPASGWDKRAFRWYDWAGTTIDLAVVVWTRVLQSGDTDPSITLSGGWASGGSSVGAAAIAAYRGVDTTTPMDATPVTGESGSQSSTWTPPSITTTTADAWVLSIVGTGDNNELALLTANGFTARMSGADYDSTVGGDVSAGLADYEKASAGAATMPEWDQAVNDPDFWIGATLALRPAGGAATVTGTAAGTAAASGTVVGTRTTFGVVAGSADGFIGAVVGTRIVSGTAAGTAGACTGTAVGTVTPGTGEIYGEATGTASFAGTIAGSRITFGAAAGGVSFAGSVQGVRTSSGAATGGVPDGTGSVVGTRTTFGAAIGGTAAGAGTVVSVSATVVIGTAHGPHVEVTGTVVGTRTVFGTAVSSPDGGYGFVNGTRVSSGTAIGAAAACVGAVRGARTTFGVCAGASGSFAGLAVGAPYTPVTVTGSAAGTVAGAGRATGRTRDPFYNRPSPYYPNMLRRARSRRVHRFFKS
jgi:hypothetical protein